MSVRRLLLLARQDFGHSLKRPLHWFLALVLVLTLWGLSSGVMRISSGDSSVGGAKAFLTSEFAQSQMWCFLSILYYGFFVAVAAGMAPIRDEDWKVSPLLHATPLTPGEYVWGRFTGVLTGFLWVVAIHIGAASLLNHQLAPADAQELIGPWSLVNYVKPFLVFGLPWLLFVAGTSFWAGARFKKPVMAFLLPVVFLFLCAFFLWDWSPSWLSNTWNEVLMVLDPSGFRWLNETHLKVDRGAAFYNNSAVPFDGVFLLNRLWVAGLGLAGVVGAHLHLAKSLRTGEDGATARARKKGVIGEEPQAGTAPAATGPLAGLNMAAAAPGFLAVFRRITSFEVKALLHQPGMYIFLPIILLQTIGSSLFAVGPFETPLLLSSGVLATNVMDNATIMVLLLYLFYAVESLEREERAGISAIVHASPMGTGALLAGKAVANALIGVGVLAASFLGCAIALLVQGKAPIQLTPFLMLWGVLLMPTFLLWTAFLGLMLALTRNRAAVYGIGLAALIATIYFQFKGSMSWPFNWWLFNPEPWTDLGAFQYNRLAILLNRAEILGFALLFTYLAVRFFPRREDDATRVLHGLRPLPLFKSALRLLPAAIVPLGLALTLGLMIRSGPEGKAMEKAAKDYWRKNIQTYKDVKPPAKRHAEIDLTLDPATHGFAVKGHYVVWNHTDKVMRRIPVTARTTWKDLTWTWNGAEAKPEDRKGLWVFHPENGLAPGEEATLGFSYHGNFPEGVTKNGGGNMEFILPAGVVLTSFSSSFTPTMGFMEGVGVDKDNRSDAKEFEPDFYTGELEPDFGGKDPYTVHTVIHGPADWTFNGVGVLKSDTVKDGTRTMEWNTDHPVRFFNVVGGRWEVKKGEGTALYYYKGHPWNIDEMTEALDGARKYYSEWFYPYPWQELKVSEFPGLASYAQGFPTNITFSESIGFLAKSDPKSNIAFMVTAHESAHQWWGNLLTPGRGPSGAFMSEAMAHFSTALLFDQMKGQQQRAEFMRRIEARYNERRQDDAEKPILEVDGTRDGDSTVIYDKGGWAFWMLMHTMGREEMLAGTRAFIEQYKNGPDYPVVHDYLAALRPYARDPAAFDAFVKQWFASKVVPEFKIEDPKKEKTATGWRVTCKVKNVGTGDVRVDVAASREERWKDDPKDKLAPATANPDYKEQRVTISLSGSAGATAERVVVLDCPFEPTDIVIDPDVQLLMLDRRHATKKL